MPDQPHKLQKGRLHILPENHNKQYVTLMRSLSQSEPRFSLGKPVTV